MLTSVENLKQTSMEVMCHQLCAVSAALCCCMPTCETFQDASNTSVQIVQIVVEGFKVRQLWFYFVTDGVFFLKNGVCVLGKPDRDKALSAPGWQRSSSSKLDFLLMYFCSS